MKFYLILFLIMIVSYPYGFVAFAEYSPHADENFRCPEDEKWSDIALIGREDVINLDLLDKTYEKNDEIRISGNVIDHLSEQITIKIFDDKEKLIETRDLILESDGNFSTSFLIGESWESKGFHKITINNENHQTCKKINIPAEGKFWNPFVQWGIVILIFGIVIVLGLLKGNQSQKETKESNASKWGSILGPGIVGGTILLIILILAQFGIFF